MEVFITILTGVAVFALSQFILKLLIEPIVELKQIIGRISYILLLNQSKLINAVSDEKISNDIKRCSSELLSTYTSIPFNLHIHKIFWLPSYENAFAATKELNMIHYFMCKDAQEYEKQSRGTHVPFEISRSMSEIGKLLKIKISYEGM
ncbi:hypothetical protein [Legionella longbeachae]|uniref:Uncharacterized protein n=1 Tax=Legionella longbeachae serogroup 1 (strain NSW150) TaxID=661367 RepID=D3HJA3_LEGLN|nr:hypothetical protein [Legionella longbeachae]HBD7398714.1 hypothetical protein [Legionella pneumophila]ARM32798.1 hypothetical protein B0B39_04390 [Legionella longbeachae]EEZ94405.1 conserved hypothetical protein [Legionella longbeachae D-4968]QIN32770.1 hypothetical protein GCB94_11770 [Legionella longbeachae]QIN36075.1 hypothetical protein GCS73_10775 [Legionella longbeachae]